jgi:hypothetical protein
LSELSLQPVRGTQLLGPTGWQVHRSQLLGGRCAYEGTDPVQGIGGESVPACMVEPLNGCDQPNDWLPTGTCRLPLFPVNALNPHRYPPIGPSQVRVG